MDARADGKVVGRSHNVDAVWEVALTANVFLEGGTRGAAAVDFPIEYARDQERGRERPHVRRHHLGVEGARKGPADVARGVSHLRRIHL